MTRHILLLLAGLLAFANIPLRAQLPMPAPSAFGNLGVYLIFSPSPTLITSAGASTGAVVDRVVPGSPAARAGLATGDVIVQIGEFKVASAFSLNDIFRNLKLKPDQTVKITYFRKGQPQSGEAPTSEPGVVFPRMRLAFVAKQVQETHWIENGLARSVKIERKLYRDSSGRMAIEEFAPELGKPPRRRVSIFDPARLINVDIDDVPKKVVVTKRTQKLPAGFEFKEEPSLLKWVQNEPSEHLGTRIIEGLTCKGYRTRQLLENPDALGITSGGPLVFTAERWLSDLTIYPVLEISENPLQGKVVYRLEEIQQGVEPDPKIFEIPEGYKVEEEELADVLLRP